MYIESPEIEIEESEDMSSFNHGFLQLRIGGLLDRIGKYTPVGELSLDTKGLDLSKYDLKSKEELKPDICLYSRRGLSMPRDILRMSETPMLAIEILSPKQGIYEIMEKFNAYFDMGIKSCWLVIPATTTLYVYSSPTQWKTFSSGEVIDDVTGVKLSVDEIFR